MKRKKISRPVEAQYWAVIEIDEFGELAFVGTPCWSRAEARDKVRRFKSENFPNSYQAIPITVQGVVKL